MNQRTYSVTGMSCNSCVRRIENGMMELPDITSARVDFGAKTLALTFQNSPITFDALQKYLSAIGHYDLQPYIKKSSGLRWYQTIWFWGLAGAAGITLLFYFAQALGMQSWTDPLWFSLNKWYFVLPLIAGFGTQMGLFRAIHLKVHHGGGGVVAASGGVSTTSMIACCMHNLVSLFPILGFSGLAVFFATYQNYVFGVSLLFVLGGVTYMVKKYKDLCYNQTNEI